MHKGQQVILIGAICLIVGTLLPWASVASVLGITISKAGYEGDGLISGGIGVLLLLSALLSKGKPGKMYSPAASVFALVAGVVAILDIINVSQVITRTSADSTVIASVGSGLYVTLLGALLGFVGGLVQVPLRSQQESIGNSS
jgi:hypothetical protein